MPKVEIDYSNTIIYKITCNDDSVKDVYVGHTTNFVQRKHAHKQSCINEKAPNHKCKLYKVIRENGGWFNWRMEIINFFNCKDHYEARIKEQEYFVLLNATLNSIEPMPKPKDKTFTTENQQQQGATENLLPISSKFYCENCDFKCSYKKDYLRHIETKKHAKCDPTTLNDNVYPKKPVNIYTCKNCDKEYKDRVGLWRHKKKCTANEKEIQAKNLDGPISNETVLSLIKDNQELTKLLVSVIAKRLGVDMSSSA
jgi:hypothetical protein